MQADRRIARAGAAHGVALALLLGVTGCERRTVAESGAPPPVNGPVANAPAAPGASAGVGERPGPLFPDLEDPPRSGRTPGVEGEAQGTRSIPDLDDPALPRDLPGSIAPTNIPEGLVTTTVFGRQVYGLDPELVARLREAERMLQSSEGTTDGYGVASISGYRPGSRSHARGLAIDVNYFLNPYIMHEQGEEALDARLAPVYHRIARLMLGRDSVIPEQITLGTPSEQRTLRLYDELREESRAMVTYFRLMQSREDLARYLETLRAPVRSEYLNDLLPDGSLVTAGSLQQQMMADYVTLSGRAGPPVPGMEYPAPDLSGGDPPFVGDPAYRGPEKGFLNMPRELVRALTRVGMRWGAVDLGGSSGDVMHFDLPRPAPRRRWALGVGH